MRGYGRTHVGHVRQNNEDAILVDDDLGVYAVADGMGGHAAGEIASELALSVVSEGLYEVREQLALARTDDDTEQIEQLAKTVVQRANAAVHEQSLNDIGKLGMGSTLTILIPVANRVVIAHVGDSRALLFRGGGIEQLTRDHTLANDLATRQGLSADQLKGAFYQNVLSRAIGVAADVEVDVSVVPVEQGDRLVLCSDGLTRYADELEVLAPLLDGEVSSVPDRLVEFANDAGGRDNVSAVVVNVGPAEVAVTDLTALAEAGSSSLTAPQ